MEGFARGGKHQGEQSTVLLKNVVPVEGTASCVFVKRKRNGLTASRRHRPRGKSSGVAFLELSMQRCQAIAEMN